MMHTTNQRPCFLPIPQSYEQKPGAFNGSLHFGDTVSEPLANALETLWPEVLLPGKAITFVRSEGLSGEGYSLRVEAGGITIISSTDRGAFYACMTLRQLALTSPNGLPCCEIEDTPELAIRGAMLDISRGKVPTVETLKQQIDLIASFKMNHLELYIEGFSFAYPSFEEFWKKDRTPLTPEEFRELDAYCSARFIELVPCQNCLGHMGQWLAKPELAHLAECPGGFSVQGITIPSTTLDPGNSASLELTERMLQDLLVNFKSNLCNVCLDEPFELGRGNSKARAEAEGLETVYLDYADQVRGLLEAEGKTMMMWGDVIGRHPGAAERVPKDIIIMEWGYEWNHPMEERAAALQKAGLTFCMCPGTNTWSSFTGITDNMMACVRSAASAARKYQAAGLITTDWGDMGHLQHLPFSWPGLCFTAACAWGREPEEQQLCEAMDRFVFLDEEKSMGAFLLAAGRYYHKEEFEIACRTLGFMSLTLPELTTEACEKAFAGIVPFIGFFVEPAVLAPFAESYEKRLPMNENALLAYLDVLEAQLRKASPADSLVKQECACGLAMIRTATRARGLAYGLEDGLGLSEEIEALVSQHRRLWLARNKPGGIEEGAALFEGLSAKVKRRLSEIG